VFGWLFKKDPRTRIANEAVKRSKKRLQSRRAPRLDAKVSNLLWSGPVEINPKHCVVWIILSGPDSERIPAQLTLSDENSVRRARESLTESDFQWIMDIAQVVEDEFCACGQEWQKSKIGIESAARVKRGGGFNYFR